MFGASPCLTLRGSRDESLPAICSLQGGVRKHLAGAIILIELVMLSLLLFSTLSLAALGHTNLPSGPIEVLIAASVLVPTPPRLPMNEIILPVRPSAAMPMPDSSSALIARNLTRGSVGRKWMAIRDMDIAAEIIGVNPLRAKLTAFAVSSFFVGISGALFFSVYLGAVEVGEVFGISKSFLVLFMIIIGGLGSIFGCFAGAAFLVLLPVALKIIGVDWLGWPTDIVAHLQLVIVGALIIVFLIAEPHGLAQLWRVAKEKLRLWPFPH